MKLRDKLFTSLIVVFVALFTITSVVNVNAANKKKSTKPVEVITKCKQSEADLIKKYDPELVHYESNDTWEIRINGNTTTDGGKYPRFKITSINGKTSGSYVGKEVYHSNQGKLSGMKLKFEKENSGKSLKIVMTTTEDPDCNKSVTLKLSAEGGYEPRKGTSEGNSKLVESTKTIDTSTTVKCESGKDYSAQGNFKERFCYAKQRGKAQHNWTKYIKGTSIEAKIDKIDTLRCSANVVTKSDVLKTAHAKDFTSYDLADGYTNISWYYATHTTTNAETTEYRYHYYPNSSGEWTKSNDGYKTEIIGCDIKCEEAVKVLYYPPQASAGGFCFQYKVKIESYVSCGIANAEELKKKKPKKSDKNYDWCTPAPICYHSGANGVTSYRQGGPNEDYEQCIKECDGGKYTQACSTKCYNKVYKKSVANKTSATDSVIPTQMGKKKAKATTRTKSTTSKYVQKEDKLLKNGASGPYYYISGGIHFHQTYNGYVPAGGYRYGIGFWYKDGGWGCCGPYTWVGDGIPRASDCTDSCHWYGCSGGQYLNEEGGNSSTKRLDKDFKENTKEYEKLIERCESHATCTKKTATFQMKVDYREKETNAKVSVYFPYDVKDTGHTKIDKLESDGQTPNCSAKKLTNTACKKKNDKVTSNLNDKIAKDFNREKLENCGNNSILIDYFGCYVGCDAKSDYMSEMTFPGSWLLDKTNEVTYDLNAGTKDDQYVDKQFCLPVNVKDVNPKWWLWRKQKLALDTGSTVTTSSEEYNNKCTSNITKTTNKTMSEKKEDYEWNIHTFIKEFGMYGWDINVDCFFATNSDPTNNNEDKINEKEDCKDAKCCTEARNYQARAVDLTHLFPAEDGTPGSSRDAGYNWTSEATLSSNMFGKMGMNPEQLVNKIQQRGEKVYDSDDQIDYEFELTPQALAEIKGSASKYTNWAGTWTFYDKDGNQVENTKENSNRIVYSVYQSNFIKKLKSKKKYVDTNALKCNNVKGRNQCESFFG